LSSLRAERRDAVVSTNMDMMFWTAMHVLTLAFAASFTAMYSGDLRVLFGG
jgi:hypothetical protein